MANARAISQCQLCHFEPAEAITNITFTVHCQPEKRVFHTVVVLLEQDYTNHRWLPCHMEPHRSSEFIRGLMKTWHFPKIRVQGGSVNSHKQVKITQSFQRLVTDSVGRQCFPWEDNEMVWISIKLPFGNGSIRMVEFTSSQTPGTRLWSTISTPSICALDIYPK